MSGVSIEVSYPELRDSLARLSQVLADMTPVMAEIGREVVAQTQIHFENQAAPDGTPWKPLSVETILRRLGGAKKAFKKDGTWRKGKAEQADSLQILDASGRLKRSITFNAGPDQVEVGSDLVYARIHQLGGMAGPGQKVPIPARPYLGLSDDDGAAVVAIVRNHLAQALGGFDA